MGKLVPRAEVERRLAAFQAALRADGLVGALLVQLSDLYYFTGTTQNAHLVVPAQGTPALLVRKTLERARAESPLEHIEPLVSLRELPAALAERGLPEGTLGLELDVLPAARYLDYAVRLPTYELADCSAIVRRLRSVKSGWELERIREAGRMLAGVGGCVADALHEGMAEIELAAEIEAWLRRQGHQGVLRMRAFNGEIHYGTIAAGAAAAEPGGTDTPLVGAGPNPYVGKGASDRPIRRGEPVIVDLVGSSRGYMCDQTRTFSLGPVSGELRDAYEHALVLMHEVAGAARPGVTGAALYDLALDLAGDRRWRLRERHADLLRRPRLRSRDRRASVPRARRRRAARARNGVRSRAEVRLRGPRRSRCRELVRGDRRRSRGADDGTGEADRALGNAPGLAARRMELTQGAVTTIDVT